MKNVTIKKVIMLLSCVICLMLTGLFLVNAKNTPISASADGEKYFRMNGGASIRLQNTTDAKYNGFNFSAEVSKAQYDAWSGADYYMIIMPKSYATKGYDITDQANYVWNYDDVATSDGVFILGYDKGSYTGKVRVLFNKCNPVALDESGNETDDESSIASYDLRASVVGIKAQNAATKYVAQCVAIKNSTKVFATQASEDMRYRSILDVSIRARESGDYSTYDAMLKDYEDDYTEWYEEKYSADPTYSYTVKTYYGGVERDSYTVSGRGLHSTVDVTPVASKTGVSNTDLIYFKDDASTNCDTVSVVGGKLQGYICADSDVELHVTYTNKTQHDIGTVYAEDVVGYVSFGTVYSGAYKVLVSSSVDVTSDFTASNFRLSFDNATIFKKANWNVAKTIRIYCAKDYVTGYFKYVTQVINNVTELNAMGATARTVALSTVGADFGHWDGYFVLGNDIFFDTDYKPFGYYEDFRCNQSGSSSHYNDPTNYGFRGTFDGNGHVIDSLRCSWMKVDYWVDGAVKKNSGEPAASAFISLLHKNGVIKNVAFTNAASRWGNSFLVNIGAGTVQDVYVQMGSMGVGNTTNNDDSAVICGNFSTTSMKLTRVYVENASRYDEDSLNEDTWTLGKFYENYGNLDRVIIVSKYGINNDKNIYTIGTGTKTANVYYEADNRAHLKAQNVDYSTWLSENGDMWTTDSDGVIIPKAINGKIYSGDDKVTVSTVDFVSDSVNVTLPFSITTSAKLSSCGWNIDETITSAGTTATLNGKFDFEGRFGTQLLSVYSGGQIRWVEMIVATKVIKTRADLEGWTTIAKAQCAEPYLWGGTFILANDIQYGTGTYKPASKGGYRYLPYFANWLYINRACVVGGTKITPEGGGDWYYTGGAYKAAKDGESPTDNTKWTQSTIGWDDIRFYGFKGTFDGNGYNIEGAALGGPSGTPSAIAFATLLHKEGVIKNVSFTHVYLQNNDNFLTTDAGGTIRDVYLHVDWQGAGSSGNRCSLVAGQNRSFEISSVQNYTTRVKRVFYVIDYKDGNNIYSTPIGEGYNYFITDHGVPTFDYVGGYGNYNAQYNTVTDRSGNSYANSGMRIWGDGGSGTAYGNRLHTYAYETQSDFYTNATTMINKLKSQRGGFWVYSSAKNLLNTRNLNFSDMGIVNHKSDVELDKNFYILGTGYWKSDETTNYYKLITSNAKPYIATIRFTPDTLPIGSRIVLDSGYNYRPEAWLTDAKQASRPATVSASTVTVDAAWWGSYKYRAFHIWKNSAPDISGADDYAEALSHFRIYLP